MAAPLGEGLQAPEAPAAPGPPRRPGWLRGVALTPLSSGGPAVLVPLALGVLAAAVVGVLAPTTNVYVETRMWIACLSTGLVVSAAVAAWSWTQARVERARAEGVAEAQRESADNHRRFLLRLDHELKNPITAIQAGVANLRAAASDMSAAADPDASATAPHPGSSGPGSPAAAPAPVPPLEPAAATAISSQTQRLARLVGDLRKLAELETRPIERHPVDLSELLDEVHEAAGELPETGERNVTLSLPRAPWPLGTVPGDRDLLFLALHNLLVNAVKFTRPGDTIEVRARDEGSLVVVEVADTGVGIPDDEIAHVWEELSRGSAATGTPGSGLGLALVRVVVARHGGQVWARSRVGRGTVVGVTLPAG